MDGLRDRCPDRGGHAILAGREDHLVTARRREPLRRGTVTFDIDYSDFKIAEDDLSAGASLDLGAHNTGQNAVFEDPGTYSFEEQPGSPTVDHGTNDPLDGASDPAGRPRFLGLAPDMGAYELPAPYPVTGSASAISTTGATLNGTVDSEGSNLETSYRFEYGTTTSYGSTAPLPTGTEPGEGVLPDPQNVVAGLSNLQPATTYDYRLVADNTDGETFAANETLTTAAPVTLRVLRRTTGLGDVTAHGSDDTVHGCQPGCSLQLQTETQYTLTASAFSGSTFEGWNIAGCSGTGPCTLTLNGNATIAPTFAINAPKLSHLSASRHKPKLSFTVTAGRGNGLVTLTVTLPGDLKLVTSRHGVKLNVKGATATIRHGALRLNPRGVGSVRITLTSPAIRLVRRKHPQLVLSVQTTQSAGGYETVTRLVHRT